MIPADERTFPSVLVIGAGISGIICADRLQRNGVRVRLVDKSRGVGGRMSTRREAPWSFDHGAPLLQARDPALREAFSHYTRQGVLSQDDDGWIGVPGMTALPRALSIGLPEASRRPLTLSLGATVQSIVRLERRWRATFVGGAHDDCDAVVLAVPAPQAIALLERDFPTDEAIRSMHRDAAREVAETLGAVTMTPCWSIMLALRDDTPPAGFTNDALPSLGDSGLRAYAQHTRPGRSPTPAYVLHTSAAWTIPRLEQEASVIETVVRTAIANDQPMWHVEHLRAHRWRYAQVEHGLPLTSLWHADASLGACGDWAQALTDGAEGIERAIASGDALARQLLTHYGIPAADVILTA